MSFDCQKKTKDRQSGMTLIELMIALLLGLFVVLVVGQIFLSARSAWQTQQAQAELQEKGRFALRWVGQQLAQAGYVDPSRVSDSTNFPAVSGAFSAGAILFASQASHVQMRYWGDDRLTDCRGVNVALDVSATRTIAFTAGNLQCGNEAIVEGVSQFDLQYGEDTDATADGIPNLYRAASAVVNWSRVSAVRVCILLESSAIGVATTGQVLVDCSGRNFTPANQRLGRVFRTTVFLRNQRTG